MNFFSLFVLDLHLLRVQGELVDLTKKGLLKGSRAAEPSAGVRVFSVMDIVYGSDRLFFATFRS
jgi:hypothetical protein